MLTYSDMGSASAERMGLEEAPRRLEDTLRGCLPHLEDQTDTDQVAGMMKVILGATREHQSGNLCEWYVMRVSLRRESELTAQGWDILRLVIFVQRCIER